MGYPEVTAYEETSEFNDLTQRFYDTNKDNFVIPSQRLSQNFATNVKGI